MNRKRPADMAYHDAISVQWTALRGAAAKPGLWLRLARSYAALDLPWQAGYAARQARRFDASLEPALRALAIGPWQDAALGDGMLGRAALPQAVVLAQRFHAMLKQHPGDWLSWLYLARLQDLQGAEPSAPALPCAGHALEQACQFEPLVGESCHWLGVWRLNAGDAQGALQVFSRLLDVRPVRYGSMMYLGEALLASGNVVAAEKAFARASLSSNIAFLATLSARVYQHNYWQEAMAVLQKSLTIEPDHIPTLLSLAKIESEVYALDACRITLRRLQTLAPDHQEARLLQAGLLGRNGDAKAHLATLQAAYEAGADPLSRLASSIAMTMLYQDTLTAPEVADWHRRLCAPIEAATPQKRDFTNVRSTQRPLRIACVTGDLHRQHPVNIFMLPLLQHSQASRLEWSVYYTVSMHDEYTRQAKACVTRWTEAAALDDQALQQAIVNDEIDILIDLAGHTASHRLGVFALRAAPVQASFLGYPHSTGLAALDWLIGDATVTPAQHGHLFSEGIAQLPGSVFCWAPVDDYPLPPNRAAGLPVVFGSFNNAMKLSPKTIALWAKILQALPQAQLLLKAPSLRDVSVRQRFVALFAEQGIGPERLILRGPSGLDAMMQEYGDIDIALDPMPYNGGTTSLQALWMGVPVLALMGQNFVSRMGASFLRTLGRPEWLADDELGYVALAVELARQIESVRSNRLALRRQMAASPLCDMALYAQHFEALLQRMWGVYCDAETVRLLPAT